MKITVRILTRTSANLATALVTIFMNKFQRKIKNFMTYFFKCYVINSLIIKKIFRKYI